MAKYKKGMTISLWEMDAHHNGVVLREVLVRITDIRTGVLGEFSKIPMQSQSLKGTGDDGKFYQKHWESWPESQTCTYQGQWSTQEENSSDGSLPFWTPFESISVYNGFFRSNCSKTEGIQIWPTNKSGVKIFPKGDVSVCEKHKQPYYHLNTEECFQCLLEKRKAEKKP